MNRRGQLRVPDLRIVQAIKPKIADHQYTEAEQYAGGAVDQGSFQGSAVGGKKASRAVSAAIGPKALGAQFFMLRMPS